MTIGQRIRERRKELGLTQEELAKRLGNKTRASVCTVEKDKEDLTTTRIRQYAEALETTPAYLMGWETEEDATQKALDLYEIYKNASPEIQSAVELLLKSSQPKS